tara:strand:- start:42 stop:569 length:528 start_codon:yes stop_codon:yes gene_type:complete
MEPNLYFSTPIWHLKKDLPFGAVDWALDFEKNTPPATISRSSRGGYQSERYNEKFKYSTHLDNCLEFLPKFKYLNWWLNINRKGDFNMSHTHPNTDLACIWYITDNHNLLAFQNPIGHERFRLIKQTSSLDQLYFNKDAKAGDILIFPGDVPHHVEPHELDTPRISVSFNISFVD